MRMPDALFDMSVFSSGTPTAAPGVYMSFAVVACMATATVASDRSVVPENRHTRENGGGVVLEEYAIGGDDGVGRDRDVLRAIRGDGVALSDVLEKDVEQGPSQRRKAFIHIHHAHSPRGTRRGPFTCAHIRHLRG